MKTIFIGIDPGLSGGIAALDINGGVILAVKMPETPSDLLTVLRGLSDLEPGGAVAVLEQVGGGIFGGERKMGASSAFTFGRGYGRLEMALIAAAIPSDSAQPRLWQGAMQCRSKGNKNVTKARAQQLFPSQLKITHAVADALLIAEFCRRKFIPHTPAADAPEETTAHV